MKSQRFFWLLLAIAMATTTGVYFASCHDATSDEIELKTETVAPATDGNTTTTDDDPEVTSRGFCSIGCPIDIDMTSGDATLTICGTTDATTSCASFTSACGSTNYPFEKTVSPTGTMCICVPAGRSFRVTNNGNASVTIVLTLTGSMGTYPTNPVTIPANSSQDFEVTADANCDGSITIC